MPAACRTLAAIAARGPDSQIVTTGLAVEQAGFGGGARRAVRQMARAGDVSLVALVGLADVEELDGVVGEQLLELVEGDGSEALVAAAFLPAGEVEDRHGGERARRAQRLGFVGRVDDDRPLREDERRPRREARAGDRDPDGAGPVPCGERGRRPHVEDDRAPVPCRRARVAAARRGTGRG